MHLKSEDLERYRLELVDNLKNYREVQESLLLGIVSDNASSKYGEAHGFSSISCYEEFRSSVPIVDYEALRPWADRMLEGSEGELTSEAPSFFGRTSGTTGKPKHIPYTSGVDRELAHFIGAAIGAIEHRHPGFAKGAAAITGSFVEAESNSGTPVGSATGYVRNLCRGVPMFSFAPEGLFNEKDFDARYYGLAFCALASPRTGLSTPNPSTLLTLFKKCEVFRDELAKGLAGHADHGPAGLNLNIPVHPGQAERFSGAFDDSGSFLPQKMWPELRVLHTWKSASAAHYMETLRARVPEAVVWPLTTGSTEASMLIPLSGDWCGGVPAMHSTFFEFQKLSDEEELGELVPAAELQENCGYRLIVTNRRGLYRLGMEDVFCVESFQDGVPVLGLAHRLGQTSSLTGEKLTEQDITTAVSAAVREHGISIESFQARPYWNEPPGYLLLAEVEKEAEDLMEGFALTAEKELAKANIEYAGKRDSGRLAPLNVVLVAPGAFEKARKNKAGKMGRSDAQVKIPQLSRNVIRPDPRGASIDASGRVYRCEGLQPFL